MIHMYSVEVQLPDGTMHSAYETVLRWQAEEYYQAALEWNKTHNLNRHIRLVAYRGDRLDDVIHDTRNTAFLVNDRDWYEAEDGEPSRVAPGALRNTNKGA